jgi:hypothetical protein
MSEVDSAIRYIFVITIVLVIVAYYAGSVKVLSQIGTTATGLINASSGRDSSGNFAKYPSGS